jgi:hypothetical protein
MQLGVRLFDPEMGRFTQKDPAKDGVNWYGYAANRPTWFTDPVGLVAGRYESICGKVCTTPGIKNWIKCWICIKMVDQVCKIGKEYCCKEDQVNCTLTCQSATGLDCECIAYCQVKYLKCQIDGGSFDYP